MYFDIYKQRLCVIILQKPPGLLKFKPFCQLLVDNYIFLFLVYCFCALKNYKKFYF